LIIPPIITIIAIISIDFRVNVLSQTIFLDKRLPSSSLVCPAARCIAPKHMLIFPSKEPLPRLCIKQVQPSRACKLAKHPPVSKGKNHLSSEKKPHVYCTADATFEGRFPAATAAFKIVARRDVLGAIAEALANSRFNETSELHVGRDMRA
jgi:hypothetical protein